MFFGIIVFFLINFVMNPVGYTVTSHTELFLHELLSVAKPVFLSLVPALFIAMLEIFPFASWKRAMVVAIIGGLILCIPLYLNNLAHWQPMLNTIQGLPISEVEYKRYSGTLGSPPVMKVDFVIPLENFAEIEQTIIARLPRNNGRMLSENITDQQPNVNQKYEYFYWSSAISKKRIKGGLYRTKF